MASAVLANNNETHWGGKVYHSQYAVNNNPVNRNQFANPNPNSNPNVQSRRIQNPNPSPSSSPSHIEEAVDGAGQDDYVTINLSDYSKAELRELDRRLRAELDHVRQVRSRVEKINVVSKAEPLPKNVSSKKLSGHKRALSSGPNRELKRLAVPNSAELDALVKKTMMRCSQMLGKLMKHKLAWIFNAPVDTVGLGLHDYFDIIEQPMDLGTVKTKLKMKEYRNPAEFASDVRLTFKNAMRYNPKGQDAHIMADTLLGVFDKMFNPSNQKFELEKGRILAALGMKIPDIIKERKGMIDNVQRPIPQPKALPVHRPAEVVPMAKTHGPIEKLIPQTPKLKAKEVSKRVMTFEEKGALGEHLQELSSDEMEVMLEILRKGNAGMDQIGDEIELDLEILDNETLWELDRFVKNLKKEQAPLEKQSSPAPEVAPQIVTNIDIAEEDVDIGDDIPLNNYPPVEIEKDNSRGSSSSGSGSSSSSGSVSSSGSDSEEDSVQSPFVEPK